IHLLFIDHFQHRIRAAGLFIRPFFFRRPFGLHRVIPSVNCGNRDLLHWCIISCAAPYGVSCATNGFGIFWYFLAFPAVLGWEVYDDFFLTRLNLGLGPWRKEGSHDEAYHYPYHLLFI